MSLKGEDASNQQDGRLKENPHKAHQIHTNRQLTATSGYSHPEGSMGLTCKPHNP